MFKFKTERDYSCFEESCPETLRRQTVMALCAQASSEELVGALDRIDHEQSVEDLRRAETGLVMVRGRMGGDGRPFNLGEATVTRATVRIPSGETGFAYQLGRDARKARVAAILDALWQDGRHREAVESALEPIRERLADERGKRSRQTAATRVNFFTMVRGED